MLDFLKLSATYQQALLRQVVPFWLKHGRDEQCGGYFDLLSTTGEVIEGDKCITQQAQQTWAFAWLYNTLDGQPTWLEHARHGANFLSQFAHNDTLSCYAQLDRRGRAVAASTDAIPDCSVVMAYAQLHRATGNDEWAMLAKQTFTGLLQHRDEIRAEQAETIGGFRQIRHLSEPIAVLKTVLEMQPLLSEETWKQALDGVVQELLNEFVDRRTDVLREFILPEGAFVNTPEGRRVNVGLTFQTASYLLDFSAESGLPRTGSSTITNRKLATQLVGWCLRLCEQAWDELAGGGLNQYIDVKQQPLLFPDGRQKWAWVQVEAMATLVKCYVYTRQPDCLKWFKRIHDYSFHNFPDAKHIGWHIAVDQHGQPLVSAKSLSAVGCFSLIRCLAETAQLLTKCEPIQPRQTGTRVLH
ncbi:AGE family epimerase/isomerase [Spirosoma migulaei]